MNEQKTRQNRPPTFVNSKTPLRQKSAEYNESLQEAFLGAAEYQKCSALWVRKGENIWTRSDKTEDKAWRQKVVNALKINRDARRIIVRSMRRSKECERYNLRKLLEKAGNDLLMFLNLAGVPPIRILGELQYWNRRHMILQGLRKRLRSNVFRRQDIRDLKSAARVLEYYRPLFWDLVDKLRNGGHQPRKLTAAEIGAMSIEDFEKEIAAAKGDRYRGSVLEYGGFQVPREYPSGQYLLAIAKMIEIETPSVRKNGAPKVDFSLAVKILVEICQSELAAAGLKDIDLSKETKSYITLAQRALFGFITALLMGSFPEWFRRQENPVRNVKNAYRVKRESYL